MISILSYTVALIVSLSALLFTVLTLVIAVIIAGLVIFLNLAFLYYIGREIGRWFSKYFLVEP